LVVAGDLIEFRGVGMTPERAKGVDERRKRITELIQKMFLLKQDE
jgi:hypothetical protein